METGTSGPLFPSVVRQKEKSSQQPEHSAAVGFVMGALPQGGVSSNTALSAGCMEDVWLSPCDAVPCQKWHRRLSWG